MIAVLCDALAHLIFLRIAHDAQRLLDKLIRPVGLMTSDATVDARETAYHHTFVDESNGRHYCILHYVLVLSIFRQTILNAHTSYSQVGSSNRRILSLNSFAFASSLRTTHVYMPLHGIGKWIGKLPRVMAVFQR